MNLLGYVVATFLLLLALHSDASVTNDASGASEADIKIVLDKAEANFLINLELAERLLSHAQGLADEAVQSEQSARLLNLLAHVDILKHQLNDAYAKANAAEKVARKVDSKLQLAEAIRRQGIINFLLGFDADALALLTNSLRIHQQLNSPYVLNNLQAIGNVYARNDDWSESLIEIGQQLVHRAVIRDNSYYEAQGYSFIVLGLINQGDYQKAQLNIDQALSTLNDNKRAIYYYAALAESKLENYQFALSYINKHLDGFKTNSTVLLEMAGKLLKAEILMLDNQYQMALPLLQQTLEQAEVLDFSDYHKQALYSLASYYEKTAQPILALDYFKQYEALKEKELSTNQTKQLAFSRARLELEQKNQQITELELSQQLSQQQNTYQLYFISLSSAIIVLLLVMYWRLNQQKRVLREYSAELKQASEAKSDFLSRMSHEIRTPINAIIGLTKLSRQSSLSQYQQETNLQQIEESSNTLLGVINDILDFSKIEAGQMHIDNTEFELDRVIEQAMRLQSLKAQEKGLELIEYIARDVPLLLKGDALRIQQILNNLLSNAVKFTQRGVVSVSVNKKYSETGLLLEIAVKDTGVGLEQAQVNQLFDAFKQADESTTRKFGGTGLGLTICKQLVELMGGEIWAESLPGQGSTFYFTLKTEAVSSTEQLTEFSVEQIAKMKVLVVDDVDLSRQAAANALFRININPDIAENGEQAIDKVRQAVELKEPYQLIILDWKMPIIDGIEVASIINQTVTPKPRIIMLSAYDMDTLQSLGKPLGVDNFLHKPINSSSLLSAILTSTNKNTIPTGAVRNKGQAIPNLSGMHILLVEDNKLNRKVARGFLTDTHADIAVAENGQIALQMIGENPSRYDLILMDIQMPVMDGLTVTSKIRNELKLQIPIIAMTANAMKGDMEKSLAAGMNAHITKPLDPDYLYHVLDKVLLDKPTVVRPPAEQTGVEKTNTDSLTHIDTELAIRQLRIDQSAYWELVSDFINLENNLVLLADAVKQQDSDIILNIIHMFSPALSYIGANGLAELANQIVIRLRQEESEFSAESYDLIEQFQAATSELMRTLKARIR